MRGMAVLQSGLERAQLPLLERLVKRAASGAKKGKTTPFGGPLLTAAAPPPECDGRFFEGAAPTMSSPETDEPSQEPSAPVAAVKQFPCRQCGAKVAFQPGTTALQCPFCGAENRIPQSEDEVKEEDYFAALERLSAAEGEQERTTVKCQACGAETTLPPNVTSDRCPFCGADLVLSGASRKVLRPKSLLPFKVAEGEAGSSFEAWLKSRWFAPRALRKEALRDRRLQGVYLPYWTYDCDATTFYRGERGVDYTVTVGSGKHRRTVRRTRWTSVSGTVWNDFDDVLILASRSLPQKYTEELEPWDLKNLVPYADEYLSGFRAESYQVDLKQGFELAKGVMQERIEETVREDIGGDHQRIQSTKTRYDRLTFKHILLPVWVSAYRYKERVFRFLVNARTGEVQGERPWSWVKIGLVVLAGLAAVLAATALYMRAH
jgi:predicted RNA-binding Zn-ribbon protein involved in translation (DUF1610 family)